MEKADFQPGFPGRFVSTEFSERGADGRPRVVRGDAFVPDPLPPKVDTERLIGRLYVTHDDVRSRLLKLDGVIDSLPGRTLLLSGMRLREAQASSKIENTFARIKDVALATPDESRVHGDAVEVNRNRQAITQGLVSSLPMSVRLLREMHEILSTDPSKRPGKLRDIQVLIGDESRGFRGSRFVPPPASVVEGCMRELELFCNPRSPNAPESPRLPYLFRLAVAHYQFETIHPFSDGNGRRGRAMVTIAPVKDGELRHPVCNLSEWVQARRQEYYDRLLRVSTHGDWEGWIGFFCGALAEQAEADLKRADRLAKLYAKYQSAITTKRGSIILTKLLDHLFEHQAVTIRWASEIMGVSYPAAKRHVDRLVADDVLDLLDDAKTGKVYVAEGVIEAIRGDGED